MKLVVTAVVHNVADRINPWLDLVQQVLRTEHRSAVLVTDDASSDETVQRLASFGARVRQNEFPVFDKDEELAYQQHYDWITSTLDPETWVLYLHPDEGLSNPRKIAELARIGAATGRRAVGLPLLYEWEEGQVRTDGYWVGESLPRLFAWQPGGAFLNKRANVPPVPLYALQATAMQQTTCALVDRRYLGIQRRKAQYDRLTSMLDPGMAPEMVESILDTRPVLETYASRPGDAPSRALRSVS
jgi:glycosyltransferase involved in cell wall biosynthesis